MPRLDQFQPIGAIATTAQGLAQLQRLVDTGIPLSIWVPSHLASTHPRVQSYDRPLAAHLENHWCHYQAWIFALACGAVVRLIAPLLTHKRQDPAVCVLSEDGQWIVSLLGSHGAGGDRLCQALSAAIGATPILTGASHAQGYFAVDTWGTALGWQRGAGDWNAIASQQAQGKPLQVYQTCGSSLWRTALSSDHPLEFVSTPPLENAVWITEKALPSSLTSGVAWHPRVLWLGIGCERGTSAALIQQAIDHTLAQAGLSPLAIAGLASIDRKADEVGLCQVAEAHDWPSRWFSAQELAPVSVPTPSTIVAAEMGTPSVAEAAAVLASEGGRLIVPKQIYRQGGEPGAVTIAIAQSEREFIPRQGALSLIGTGPGALDQLTLAARSALLAADILVGYGLYLELLAPLRRPGQMVAAYTITQERQRAQAAIDLAQWGLNVAVVSSGDCGIYGMAGLVLELLAEAGISDLPVEVLPGVSAVNAAAARLGAPLMHDFCTISLSDRLTPWPVIEKRLRAAAEADFVTALYNPRSRDRQQQLVDAKAIFLKYRSPQTPVAIVRAAYRPEEHITLTTLGALKPETVDMFSLVLIGNASTRCFHDWLITPRGYLGKAS
ncbi:precorrin-3B C(17)-methyltransferase [Thermosynechococcus sp. QKsg1]|uniref:precorrin-3B C(17)-methyltransferase n=1 Tax=unclassified Thermosynechococcus TaxID=2622553 RepID=UPI002576904A|nr:MULTISPECIES: precorrin-3B C(17)-methyltransferase [unclassified Thermosynechococcus]WJI23499.1 precorrin-3B C(17)-methyltransferase [Thermosynechococcus sp. B0]WNC86132.1 precorrin-3B C(17)-methyltransferase [Thermosynechococcus sp. QKsg1]